MSLNNDHMQRNKPNVRLTTAESHIPNLPPPPSSMSYSLSSIRPSAMAGNLNILPPPSTGETISTFSKERFHDVLQQGLGTYVYIENFGLVPKLNHF